MADPSRDIPFLTTRELFTLKLDHWPALAHRYLAASPATTVTGHSYVVAVLAENPSAPIPQATAAPALISAIKGAFTLAARG